MALLELKRRGSTFLFVVVVVGHIVLISAQVTSKSGVPVLQAVAFGLVAEVQRAGAAIAGGMSSLWVGYVDLRGTRAQNLRLQRELDASRIRLQQERASAARSEGLARLLDLRTHTALETSAAEVLAGSASPEFRTITVGKGTSDGLRPDMAVIAPSGVVGRVIVPSADAAKVQLLVDRNAAVGALIERSRSQGVAVGEGTSLLRLDFVSDTSDIRVGDTVVTSGIDGIYPKGFVIGKTVQVERAGGSYRMIQIQPAVDFSSLEDVLVVLTPVVPDLTPTKPAPRSADPPPVAPKAPASAAKPAIKPATAPPGSVPPRTAPATKPLPARPQEPPPPPPPTQGTGQ
jgi:rod shape-determining protein MreC